MRWIIEIKFDFSTHPAHIETQYWCGIFSNVDSANRFGSILKAAREIGTIEDWAQQCGFSINAITIRKAPECETLTNQPESL